MSGRELSRQELDRHRRAVDKLRRELFRIRSPTECWVVGEEIILPPSVRILIELDSGQPNRTVRYGGLEYRLQIPLAQDSFQVSVEHWEEDRFWMCVTWTPSSGPASYTRFSLTVPFKRLADEFCRCLDMIAAERSQSWARGGNAAVGPERREK
jgi:hypothetical protein